jgi:hypothetical protein
MNLVSPEYEAGLPLIRPRRDRFHVINRRVAPHGFEACEYQADRFMH